MLIPKDNDGLLISTKLNPENFHHNMLKCSNILFVALCIFGLFANISKNLIGYWTVLIYLLVMAASFYLIFCVVQRAQHATDIPNLWFVHLPNIHHEILANNCTASQDEQTICLVCNDRDCNRHDQKLSVYLEPWKHLLVDSKVNAKLEEFLNFLLEKYTSSWIEGVTVDPQDILVEFKQIIRILASALVLRVKCNLELSDLILKKITKYLMHHLEMYVHGKRTSKSARFLEESVLRQYGELLHPALVSPDEESRFLKSVSNLIIHTTMPPKYIKCEVSQSILNEFISCCILSPLIEIFIDPDKINIFLICLLQRDCSTEQLQTSEVNGKVEFLNGFSALNKRTYPSQLGVKLKQILDDQHLLFLFTQYAKEEHFLNYLQFIIHMNSFLNRIMNPDLNDKQLLDLHEDLKNTYGHYFVKTSKDYIQFENSICDEFETIITGIYTDVEQFRNSKSLYEAYEHASGVLNFYCSKFFHTDIYLKLICGQRAIGFNLGSQGSKESSSMKVSHSKQSIESVSLVDDFDDSPTCETKDLSNWKVAITRVVAKTGTSGRESPFYEIEVVKSEPLLESKWIVERQFNEFYTLESKLKEFHGEELDNVALPAKKPFSRINRTLLEQYRGDLEEFLRQLLDTNSLRRSELIYAFLTSAEATGNSFVENFNFTKIIKNVPSKFAKERGQHLSWFLRNFVNSNEKRNSSLQSNDVEEGHEYTGTRKRNFTQRSHIDFDVQTVDSLNTKIDRIHSHIEYIYDYIMLILIRFYNLNNSLLQFLYMIRPLVRQTFQGFCEYFVRKKLKKNLFTPDRVVELINNLESSLEEELGSENLNFPLNLTKSQRSEMALRYCKDFVPRWLVEYVTDYNKHEEVIFLLFSLLQHRLLNKQLFYLIFTSVISDLYPPALYSTIEQH